MVLNFQRDSGILGEDQYAMINFENGSKKWVLTLLNKGLIVDENQFIKEGFGVFTSNNFESILTLLISTFFIIKLFVYCHYFQKRNRPQV